MDAKTTELYKALDRAIGGFQERVLGHAREALEEEWAAIEPRILEVERVLRELSQLRASGGTSQLGKQPIPTKTSSQSQNLRGTLPRLPKDPSVRGLAKYLEALGFEVANYREVVGGGGLWVFTSQGEFEHVAKHLKLNGVDSRYYPKGRRRRPESQYEIDPLKRLPL